MEQYTADSKVPSSTYLHDKTYKSENKKTNFNISQVVSSYGLRALNIRDFIFVFNHTCSFVTLYIITNLGKDKYSVNHKIFTSSL